MTQPAVSTHEGFRPGAGSERIKDVPASAETRSQIRDEAVRLTAALDRSRPLHRPQLEQYGRELLHRLELSPTFLGFAMVAIDNAFWHDQFAAIPPSRRVLLLPHCLRNANTCRGAYDEAGLTCAACGSCILEGLVEESESLGYTVAIVEGTPVVVQLVLNGEADAVLGIACLDSLEKAFRPVAELGIPHAAVPLLKDGCADTTAEVEALKELLYLNNGQEYTRTRSFLPLLRAARALFDEEPLAELLSDCTSVGSSSTEAGAATAVEGLALDWLRAGGKRFRPFITLASYAALAHDAEVLEPDADLTSRFPLAVKRIALAIEILHKASLIHDDIEDDDAYRYGRETIHRSHGTPTAINVGDYLIGLGYRLVSATRAEIGAACVADILAHLAEAHLKLCRGQGAEIALTGPGSFSVRTSEVQRIYALKTAPAFEVALYAGIRAAAPEEDALPADADLLRRYCRFVGVAYQLLNDLKDWRQDNRDKLVSGQDLLAARPTLLRALLLEALDEDGKARLRKLGAAEIPAPEKIARMRRLYESMDVFQKAAALLQKYRDRARTLVDDTQPPVLAELMRFVVETVL